jgi:hypothetical protein
MTTAGILVMGLSVGTVTLLFIGCVWKVLSSPSPDPEPIHGIQLHTPDMDEVEPEE